MAASFLGVMSWSMSALQRPSEQPHTQRFLPSVTYISGYLAQEGEMPDQAHAHTVSLHLHIAHDCMGFSRGCDEGQMLLGADK